MSEHIPKNSAGPHSRACGPRSHAHGSSCHSNCPTCNGREATAGVNDTKGTEQEHQTIVTWQELDALPVGSIVIDPFDDKEDGPVICCRDSWGHWRVMGDKDLDRVWSPQLIVECARRPIRVIHIPKGGEQ